MKKFILAASMIFVGLFVIMPSEGSEQKKADLRYFGFTVEGQKPSAEDSDSLKKEMANLQSERMQALSYWKAKQIKDDVNFITKYFYENRRLTEAEQTALTPEQKSERFEISTMSPKEILKGLSMPANNQPLVRLRKNIAEAKFDMPLVNDMMMAISDNDLNKFNNKKNAILDLIKPVLEQTGYITAAMSNVKGGIISRMQRVYDYLKNNLMPNFNKGVVTGEVITKEGTIEIK